MAFRLVGKKDKDRTKEAGSFGAVAQYLGLGTQLAAAVAGFGLLGYWIDSRAGTGTLYTTIFLFVGAFGGMYSFIKTVIRLGKETKEEQDEDRRGVS